MAFNSLGQYVPNHKTWDHVGNILPDIELSEGERPHLDTRPAAWLPVQFYDKHYENWNVIMPGKAVALDPWGYLMPAQYGLTGASVVYTQNDVDAGVIDIATGEAVTAAKTVVLSELTGVRDGSWTAATAGTTGITSGFMGVFGSDGNFADATAKYAIGVAPYAYLQWAGGDGNNPAQLRQHNYIMQHRTSVLCDYVLQLPLVPAQEENETVDKTLSVSDIAFGTRATHKRSNVQANDRYNATYGTIPVLGTYPVIALALDEVDLAKNTSRTQLTMSSSSTSDDLSGVLAREVSSVSAIRQAGDFWVDEPVGVVFLYSADGATVPSAISGASGTVRITYYRYGTAATTVSKFATVVGPLVPGDFLKVGANSNLVQADPSSDNFAEIVGQVVGIKTRPVGGLDRVRTAFNPAISTDASGGMANGSLSSLSTNAGQLDKMPGSANGGVPALVSYAGGADTVVYVNLISR